MLKVPKIVRYDCIMDLIKDYWSKLWVRAIVYLLFAILFSAGLLVFMAVRPSLIKSELTPADLGLVYEDAHFETDDGVEIAGWFIPRQSNGEPSDEYSQNKTIVALHGYPADKGNILPLSAGLIDDYNLFMFDFRYHGESGGSYSGLGSKETKDMQAALGWLKQEKEIEEVGVWGFSFGASIALMSAAEMDEIQAVYAESGYSNLYKLAKGTIDIPLLGRVLVETGYFMALTLGIDMKNTGPSKVATDIDVPVYISHSRDDEVIDFSHAKDLKSALGNNLVGFDFGEGRAHGELGQEGFETVESFFENYMIH